jgi:5,10-methylenetetrahydromethanopterin reductase
MLFGLGFRSLADVSEVVKGAVLAEKKGFDYLWGWEDVSGKDVFMHAGIIAMRTQKVKIGPMAFYPYLMSPVATASAILTLNEISKGRAVIGLAAGNKYILSRIGLEWKKPITLIKEVAELIKSLSKGREVIYEGAMVKVRRVKFQWVSGRPISIYVSGNGPKMLHMAGAVADGVNMAHIPAEYIPTAKEFVIEGAREAGRDPDKIEIQTSAGYCFIADDYNKAMAQARDYWFFSVLPSMSFPFILEKTGFKKSEISALQNVALSMSSSHPHMPKSSNAISDELIEKVLEKFALVGTVDDCIKRLKEYKRNGLQQFRFGFPPQTNIRKMIDLVGEKIIPAFKE